jgi:hypothetical protein
MEQEGEQSYFSFYLLIGGEWKMMTFKKYAGVTGIYQATSMGVIVDVAMEEGDSRPRLQLLVEVEGNNRFWMIYWWPSGVRV